MFNRFPKDIGGGDGYYKRIKRNVYYMIYSLFCIQHFQGHDGTSRYCSY
jgi:hypothetical protein